MKLGSMAGPAIQPVPGRRQYLLHVVHQDKASSALDESLTDFLDRVAPNRDVERLAEREENRLRCGGARQVAKADSTRPAL